jgi:hypothetical protein
MPISNFNGKEPAGEGKKEEATSDLPELRPLQHRYLNAWLAEAEAEADMQY